MELHHQVVPEAVAASDRPDIGALYLVHRDTMYRVARAMLRGADQYQAEDVVQEVMVSVIKHPPTGVRNWEAFFVSAVKRKILDLWKSAYHRHERLVLSEVTPVDGDRLAGDQLDEDPAQGVADLLQRQRTVALVREAMSELELQQAQAAYVLWQSAGHERSSAELAAELGVSSSRVRQIAGKARKDLIRILTEKGVDR